MLKPFQELLDTAIAEANSGDAHVMKNWHSSNLGSCLTGVYLKRLGVKPDEEFDPRLLRVFSVGNQMEDWALTHVKKEAEKNGYKFETQVGFSAPEHDLSGRCDAMITPLAGQPFIYELKTKHSKAFWYMKTKGADFHHRLQLWSYLFMKQVPKGHIVYISKDDLCINEYPVFLDEQMLKDRVMAELGVLNEAWKLKLPPPVMFDEKDWRAKYCSFHKQCVSQKEYLEVGTDIQALIGVKH